MLSRVVVLARVVLAAVVSFTGASVVACAATLIVAVAGAVMMPSATLAVPFLAARLVFEAIPETTKNHNHIV